MIINGFGELSGYEVEQLLKKKYPSTLEESRTILREAYENYQALLILLK